MSSSQSVNRRCPYCSGEMHYDESRGFLVCNELCQHRQCTECEEPIHKDSVGSNSWYDNNHDSTCYVEMVKYVDYFGNIDWQENIVEHAP